MELTLSVRLKIEKRLAEEYTAGNDLRRNILREMTCGGNILQGMALRKEYIAGKGLGRSILQEKACGGNILQEMNLRKEYIAGKGLGRSILEKKPVEEILWMK